jgi:hypothetical protein
MPCARCLSARAESYLHILAFHLLPWQIRVVRSSTRCPGTCRVRTGPAFQGCHACASGGSGPRGLQGAVCRWQGPLQGAQGLHGTMPEGGHPEKIHVWMFCSVSEQYAPSPVAQQSAKHNGCALSLRRTPSYHSVDSSRQRTHAVDLASTSMLQFACHRSMATSVCAAQPAPSARLVPGSHAARQCVMPRSMPC